MTHGTSMRSYNPTCALPEELIALDQWIVWKAVPKPGKPKPDKVPRDRANTRNVDAHGRANQMPHDDAVAAYNADPSLAGIGIAIREENGIVAVDLDHVIDLKTGEVDPAALEIVRDLGTYSEVSPSGDGLHLFMLGSLPKEARRKVGDIEVYDSGRFLTVTGNVFGADLPIVRNDAALDRLIARMESESRAGKAPSTSIAAPVVIDDATKTELRSALASLRADDRDLWIGVAHDLHELGEVGRALWLEWSQTSDKYQPGDAKQWDTVKSSRSGHRNVFARAQRAGWCNPMAGSAPATSSPARSARTPLAAAIEHSIVEVPIGANFMRENFPPPRMVIDPGFPAGEVILIGGHGGTLKSTTMGTFALHYVCHESLLGFAMSGGRCVVASFEDPASVYLFRAQRSMRHYSRLDIDTVRNNLQVLDCTNAGPLFVEEGRQIVTTAAFDDLRARIRSYAPRLVVIDNLTEIFSADGNNPGFAVACMRKLREIARENDAAVVVLAHVDKASAKFGAQGNSYAGTAAWHNKARSRFAFTKNDDGSITLAHEKSNYSRLADPVVIRFVDGVPVPAEGPGIAQDGTPLFANADDVAVLAAVRAASEAGITIPTATRGSSTAVHALCELPEFPKHLRARAARERITHSLVRLQRKGEIERQPYTTASRHVRERWIPADAPVNCARTSPLIPLREPAQLAPPVPQVAPVADNPRKWRKSRKSRSEQSQSIER